MPRLRFLLSLPAAASPVATVVGIYFATLASHALLVVLGTFLADAAAGFLDPRVRAGGAALRLER